MARRESPPIKLCGKRFARYGLEHNCALKRGHGGEPHRCRCESRVPTKKSAKL